jgi:serine/threonine protein kinase
MNPNDDLAAWGEPPATPAEQEQADRLAHLLEQLERGEMIACDLTSLYQASAGFRRDTGLLDESRKALSETRISGRTAPTWAELQLPDPFPAEFRLVRLLGEGAFGTVWLAEDLRLRRQVALKTLRLSAVRAHLEETLEALQNEAGILAQFSHPHLVQVHAWRQSGPDHYLILQYVSGGSLADRLKREGPLPWQLAARYVADVGLGLIAVHAKGIIHRDIKPANILWNPDADEALLTDFGVSARLAGERSVGGTPLYMAPEAFEGELSPKLDVYSLAATLFHLVTGTPPFAGLTTGELLGSIGQGLPSLDTRCQGMPAALEQVLRSGLSADRQRRPEVKEFIATLRGALNQLLADSFTLSTAADQSLGPVNLRLTVSRQVGPNHFQPVAANQAPVAGLKRNMKKVPRPPEQVCLRTGDRVRIELTTDRTGYVTVFNIGPTGDLNLLFPDEPQSGGAPPVRANQPLHVLDVELEPPIGRERLFALWSRQPLALSLEELQGVAGQGGVPASREYHATRNMVRVQQSVQKVAAGDWQAVVLELDHGA